MIIKSKQQYKDILVKLKSEKIIALDCETEEFSDTKTHAFDLALDGLGVYSEKVKAYIPVQYLDKEFQEILNTKEIACHNYKFDGVILQKQGYDVSKIKYHDTLIMSWLLNENRRNHKLKYLAESVLKVKREKIVEFRGVNKRPNKEEYGMFPDDYELDKKKWLENLGKYCIDDCKYTYKLFHKFKPKLEKEGLWKVYEKVELPIISLLIAMENRGIKVDLDYLRKIGGEIEQDVIKLQATIWKEAGKQFDINSPKQLSRVLYQDRCYELPGEFKTSTGANSTNVSALEYLLRQNKDDKLLESLVKYRELFKLHSTYIQGLLKKQRDGIIYTSFQQHRTATGRFASSAPNLQNLPTRGDKYNIRKAFVAREGYMLIICDLSQIELRVMAYLSKDPVMLRAFQENKDIHQETADIMGVSRAIGKKINFGVCYCQSSYGLASGLNIPQKEAEEFLKNYFNKFKKLAVLIVQAKNTLQKNYAIWTLLKRKRRFPKYAQAKKEKNWKLVSSMERKATNAISQGSSADIIKVQMRELAKVLPKYDAHILVSVHDEVIVEVPESKAEEVLKVVKDTMEQAIKLPGVPIIADGFISKFWKKG